MKSQEIEQKLEELKIEEITTLKDPLYAQNQMLTEEEAIKRGTLVSDINYSVLIGMVHHKDQFCGKVDISFTLKEKGTLWLDCRLKEISNLIINGEQMKSPEIYQGHRIKLENAKLGQNLIQVEYIGEYVHNGEGLHHFIDPTDGQDYIYSNFAPFFAHKMFPCFDQPSLKATMQLAVFGPNLWKYVSNQSEEIKVLLTKQEAELQNDIPASMVKFVFNSTLDEMRAFVRFKKTEKLSTYLFALIAGGFMQWENKLPGSEKYPPMRAYCRKNLAQYFEHQEHFHAVMVGMDFYSQFFDYPFPFKKYDQIVVPEFNYGAMENVGAVTFTESYIYRSETQQVHRAKRNNSIVHELCHMWFGNLVTMRWWNDIWLNQSFATFFSFLVQKYKNAELFENTISQTAPHDPWLSLLHYKKMGYDCDSKSSTHPIAMSVPDTLAAENIFDGISYGKGCSFLKQLFHYISEEPFKTALRSYFKKFEFQNTTLNDFIGQIDKALPDNPEFKEWCNLWLKTKGITELSYEIESQDGKISQFQVFQHVKKNATGGQYRDQVLDFALFYEDGENKIIPRIHIKATKQSQTILQLQGLDTPSAILLNSNDWGYTLQRSKIEQLSFYMQNLKNVKSPVDRRVIWLQLYYNAKDLEIKPDSFFELALKQLQFEDESAIIVDIFLWMGNLIKYIPYAHCFSLLHKFWTLIHQNLLPKWFALNNSELTTLLIENLIKFTYSEEDIFKAVNWITNNESILADSQTPLKLSRNYKAQFLIKIFASSYVPLDLKNELLQNVIGFDLSTECQNLRAQYNAALPDIDNKKKVWDEKIMAHDNSKSFFKYNFTLVGFTQWVQSDILKPYVDQFFDRLLFVFDNYDRRVAYTFYNRANPLRYCQEKGLDERFKSIQKKVPEELNELKILLEDSIQEAEIIERALSLYK